MQYLLHLRLRAAATVKVLLGQQGDRDRWRPGPGVVVETSGADDQRINAALMK